MTPWAQLLVAAAVALLAGYLGGAGGRTFSLRSRFSEVWDAIDQLDRRLSKREGRAGREQRDENAKVPAITPAFLQWLRNLGPSAGPLPAQAPIHDEAEGVRAARKIFAEKKAPPEGNG